MHVFPDTQVYVGLYFTPVLQYRPRKLERAAGDRTHRFAHSLAGSWFQDSRTDWIMNDVLSRWHGRVVLSDRALILFMQVFRPGHTLCRCLSAYYRRTAEAGVQVLLNTTRVEQFA